MDDLENESKKFADQTIEIAEEIGLINRISKTYKGLKYEILVYSDRISWKVADKKFVWNNSARLYGGELVFDFNTFGTKGLGQQWTDETFTIFNDRIKTIKVEWTENTFYPNGQSLGHKQFWDEFFESGDKMKAVKETTFYRTMNNNGFSKIQTILDDYQQTIVILTK